MATSPVPPKPLWQPVTMADSMGYIFRYLPMKNPEEIMAIETDRLCEIISVPSRKRFGMKKAEEIKSLAENSFGIVQEFDAFGCLIKQYMEHIRFSEQQIAALDERIAALYSSFDTYLSTIPGVGPVLGATILSEIGDISRFSSAALRCFSAAL